MSDHVHGPWVHAEALPPARILVERFGRHRPSRGPLICAGCLVPWPGQPLPDPEPRHEGYGDLADLTPWRRRVAGMVAGLNDLGTETVR